VICSLGCLLLPPATLRADEAARKIQLGTWARGITVGPGMDASGRILRDCIFIGLDLRNADLDGASLDGCTIYQCDLRNATFRDAIFSGCIWEKCNIGGADFTDAAIDGYRSLHSITSAIRLTTRQVVSTRNYKSKCLRNCIIAIADDSREGLPAPELDFRLGNLEDATFVSVDLTRCDFTDAIITGMDVNGGRIDFGQIASTKSYKERDLRGVGFGGIPVKGQWNLSGLNLTGAKFNGSGLLLGADLTDAIISGCFFRCSLTPRQIYDTRNYQEGNLPNVRFWNIDLRGADFAGMELSGCEFEECDLTNASFNDAVITNARFRARGLTAAQVQATWNYRNERMSGIQLPKEITAVLQTEKGEDPECR